MLFLYKLIDILDKELFFSLCKRIVRGDKAAFEMIFDAYYSKLLKAAAFFLGAYTYADDVVSEVFMKFLNQGKKITKIKNPDNFFFIATKNQALSYQKKLQRQLTDQDSQLRVTVSNINPESKLIEKEILQIIENTITQFPAKRKIIFEMIKEENMSYKEVANKLDLSVKGVEKQMSLAMKSLREALKKYYKDDNLNKKDITSHLSS